MNLKIITLAFGILGIFLILSIYGISNINKKEVIKLTPQEKIDLSIKQIELASYGWKTEQDRMSGIISTQAYINSIINEEKNKGVNN